jgi:PAS domain S-box-containing protein
METRLDRTMKTPSHDQVLREQAEAVLRAGSPADMPVLSEDIPKLVHELQVHHVELEMQNEELRQAQQTLVEACDHYTQLYDFSPAGYVTLTPDGIIEEANLRFCTTVGVHRKSVLHQPFHSFVAPQDWDIFRRHCLDVVASGTTTTCRLRLLPKDGRPLIMHVESMSIKDTERHGVHIETAMLDITQRETAESAVRESQRKVQVIAARLVTAQDDERRRIARDLHDDYCQRLTAAILELGMLPKRHPGPWASPAHHLQPVKALLSGLLSGLRDLSHELHPDQMAFVALDDALRNLLADFTETTRIATTFHASFDPSHLPPAVNTCVYRIVQEGLSNVRKHAKAKRVSVTVAASDSIELLIKDDGQGFEPQAVGGSHHLGLTSMRERVEQLDGTITITSRPGAGTTISIQIPIPSVPELIGTVPPRGLTSSRQREGA